ncbi:MAG: acetate--CoA ligase [Phycisphaeraceae bacterium]|nr:acetate--CoA ligase [Phycisphaeraceae bacterium]MCW5755529.1 acetate--CoA ligase [Phycisphaeraceae bacterium]
MGESGIESVLSENRTFSPPAVPGGKSPRWHLSSMEDYRREWKRSIDDPEGFWDEIAHELHWFSPWSRVLEWNLPDAKWFVGGTTNLCYNAVDRHVVSGHGEETAIIWEGEPVGPAGPEIRRLTYAQLQQEIARFANGLKSLGVAKGDVVTIYMGMVPELAIAMLACARIGAAHSVIFGGFSSQAIVDRVLDARSRVIVTCDGAWRRGKVVPLKANVDEACDVLASHGHTVTSVITLIRTANTVAMTPGRDHDWHALTGAASPDCPCEPLDSEQMLFLLYTSGSTGKPKGILHTTGGYMVHTYLTSKYVFNLHPDAGQVFWCTADCGWVTGHSYIVYGILPNRVPTLMYEGAPNYPAEDRFWDICARHKVTQFYTAPTAIRAFMKWGDHHPAQHDLSTLQVLGTVGEPINPEAWMWYRRHIGHDRCPIVDTWWQTETGGHMITPLPGVTPTKPGSCTLPFFGVDAAIVDDQGVEQPHKHGGLLVIRRPWPSMLRGIYGDRQRYIETYWSRVPGMYLAGDGAHRDSDGYFWIMGRIDDVINVSGHRLGTMEVESALVSHPGVAEAAVVGMPHEIKGTGIAAFVTLRPTHTPPDAAAAEKFKNTLAAHVAHEIGAIARPDMIRFTDALPKTRSGKIMRRLLRAIAAGEEKITQDTTTLEDFSILAKLREQDEA